MQEQSRTNKATSKSSLTIITVGQSRFYNDSTSSLKRKGSRSTVWSCFEKYTFELGCSCHRLQRMHIRSSYSKGIGWGPKPKARKITSASNSTTFCSSSIQKENELQSKLNEALERLKCKKEIMQR
uniref:Uncharacterized protein n=1 Tax=Cucumis melo TaxID=3656 RepID=A0A9I9EHD9_CUCME